MFHPNSWTLTQITSLQFPATSLSSFHTWEHVAGFCLAAVARKSFAQIRIQLRNLWNIRSIQIRRRGLHSVQVCWNQTHWPRLCYRRFFFLLPGILFWTKVAARKHEKIQNVNQTKKITPLITRGSTSQGVGFWCQHVWFGSWVQIDSVKQPIQRDTVGSRHGSLPRYLQKCTIVFYFDKILRSWLPSRSNWLQAKLVN